MSIKKFRMCAKCMCGWEIKDIWALEFFVQQVREHRKRCGVVK